MARRNRAGPDLFGKLTWKWGWKDVPNSSCANGPHEISFADNNTKMLLKHKAGHVINYYILYAEKNMITALIQGEERRTEQGDRVVGVLVLNDPNTYQWRRTDWKADGRTKEIVKCG
jgi:hypothetical protein